MTDLSLYEYQKTGAAFLAQRRYAALFDEMGVGKTAQVVHGANLARVRSVLVVAPHIGLINWQREIAMWGHLPNSAVLTNREPYSDATWNIVNYDLLQEQTDALKALQQRHFDLTVLDECQALKNYGANRTVNVYGKAGIARNADRVWLVSGSPCPNNVAELYPALKACFPHVLKIGNGLMSYEDFVRHYCRYEVDAHGQMKVLGSKSVEVITLKDALRPVMLRRTLKEVLPDLPPLRFSSVYLHPRDAAVLYEHSPAQQELWTALQAAIAKIDADDPDDAFIEALNAMESTALSTQRRLFGEAKVPIIADMIGHELHAGLDKIVIFYHHQAVGAALVNKLQRFGADRIDGAVLSSKRQPVIDEFQSNPERRVLCASLDCASTVITLTAAAHVLFAEFSWTPLTNVQAARRCARLGQRRPVLARFASLGGSLDETIAAVQARKARGLAYLFSNSETAEVENAFRQERTKFVGQQAG